MIVQLMNQAVQNQPQPPWSTIQVPKLEFHSTWEWRPKGSLQPALHTEFYAQGISKLMKASLPWHWHIQYAYVQFSYTVVSIGMVSIISTHWATCYNRIRLDTGMLLSGLAKGN